MGQVSIGELTQAKFEVHGEFDTSGALGKRLSDYDITFQFNPASLTTKQENKFKQAQANQTKPEVKFESSGPVCLSIPDIWFDTYELRTSVRDTYIDKLESLMLYVPTTHVLPVIHFVWGQFGQTSKFMSDYVFYLKSLNVEYTLFLPDGTPVRAKVGVGLEQVPWQRKDKESPDHAKSYLVRQGDTLQSIAQREYENPGEWRRIARANNIIDPLELRAGTKLLVPPILK